MTYIPTALSAREDECLRRHADHRYVVEVGALLGHSTIQLAQTADHVVSIDRHCGYQHWRNDTLRQFLRNLAVTGVARKVTPVVADFSAMKQYAAAFVFIDLDGTYSTTLAAIRSARSALIGVHDFERTSCKGVAQAVSDSGYCVLERVDSLVILGAHHAGRSR
jgi:hypothetical protein